MIIIRFVSNDLYFSRPKLGGLDPYTLGQDEFSSPKIVNFKMAPNFRHILEYSRLFEREIIFFELHNSRKFIFGPKKLSIFSTVH